LHGNSTTFTELLRGTKMGLVAGTAMDSSIGDALNQAGVPFTNVDADRVRPGAPELERYDALVLHLEENAGGLDWFRPELLRYNTMPLLLAGEREVIYRRIALQNHVGEVIFPPFLESELVFRLHRLITGKSGYRQAAVRSAKPCVLVADDDRDIGVYLKNILQNFNVEAHFVRDGKAALAAARQLLPDILLLDVGMPVMNGLEVLRCLREDPGTSSLVIALLTASSDPADVKKGADLGAVDYILKPFSHLDLTRKLRSLLQLKFPVDQDQRELARL